MREFAFDEVFGIDTTQAGIFESVRYTLEGVLEGINGTILTYGQRQDLHHGRTKLNPVRSHSAFSS